MTYLSHQLGSQIPDIIMAGRREGSIRTAKGMFYIVGFSTNTIGREGQRRPSIAERNCITKVPLVKSEPMTFQRQGGKRGGCTFFSSKLEIAGQGGKKVRKVPRKILTFDGKSMLLEDTLLVTDGRIKR